MRNTFSILFYPKKSKSSNDTNTPIYMRITINGKRSELSINRKVDLTKWNRAAGKVNGVSEMSRELNQYMNSLRHKVYRIHQRLLDEDKSISSSIIKNILIGKPCEQKMLLKIFQEHNNKVQQLIGKDFAAGTAERYKTARKHVQDYIRMVYKLNDIPVKDVDYKFIDGFEHYLKTVRNCGHNTAIKYITNFKKIIRIAYANDWINKDPFINWKAKLKPVNREFLSKEEIQIMIDKNFKIARLDQVKDIFIFCCFTGLAYADVKKLTKSDIVRGFDGEEWIKTRRTKTDTRSNIPILPTAKFILEKYSDYDTDKLLPVLSNQKMNAYLKEIADLCGIKKRLTFHLARHTFATTVTLTNGVPIESVSKMLGHKSLRTTQHYAKIIDRKVSEDMAILKSKLNQNQAISHI